MTAYHKKILLVSFGSIGQRHLKNIRELLPEADISVLRLHNTTDKSVPHFANRVFVDQKHALDYKPDAVVISSPANEHIKNAMTFMQIGAHVFIEKPLCIEAAEAKDLLLESQKNSVFCLIGYVLRFQPIMYFLKKQIENGIVGAVRSAHIEVGQYLPDWRPQSDYKLGVSAQKKLGGGVLLELSHEIDYSTWFFGFPDSLFCSCDRLSDLEIDVEDSASLIMEYTKPSKKVVVEMDFLQRTAAMHIRVVGSEGTLSADLIKETACVHHKDGVEMALEVPKMKNGNEMYLRQFDCFFSNCFSDYKLFFKDLDGYKEYATLDNSQKVVKLVNFAKESNSLGKRVIFQ